MKSIFFNTWNYLTKKERESFLLFIILDLVISFLDIVFLVALLWTMQFYISPDTIVKIDFLPGWLFSQGSVAPIGLFFILFTIKNIAAICFLNSQYRFNSAVAVRISYHNLQKFQASDFHDYTTTDSSIHVRNIHFQPLDFCQYILTGIQQFVTNAALVIFVIVAILIYDSFLFLILFALLLPPVSIVFFYIKKKVSLAKEQAQVNSERSFQHLMEASKGFVESNVYNANQFFLNRFIHYRKKYSDFLFSSISLQAMPARLIETSAVLGLLVLIFIIKQFSFQTSLLMTMGAFMAAAYKIIPGIVKLINISSHLRTYGHLVTNETTPGIKSRFSAAIPIHSVELKNVQFSFGDSVILDNIDMKLEKGVFAGIQGRSGIGKTSLFNLILGFYAAESGKILVNGIARGAEQLQSFWPNMAYVKQQNFLINDTILRNICLEDEVSDPERFEEAVRVSGLTELLANFPEGVNKIILENGRNLSGGQQQRIAIARAVYKRADLILLDEPFCELDESSEQVLLQHFRRLAESGRIVIMISHNSRALDYCHTIISLDADKAKNTDYYYAGVSGN